MTTPSPTIVTPARAGESQRAFLTRLFTAMQLAFGSLTPIARTNQPIRSALSDPVDAYLARSLPTGRIDTLVFRDIWVTIRPESGPAAGADRAAVGVVGVQFWTVPDLVDVVLGVREWGWRGCGAGFGSKSGFVPAWVFFALASMGQHDDRESCGLDGWAAGPEEKGNEAFL